MGPGDGDAGRLKDAVNGNPTSGTLYLGTSGFYYDHWVGVLYPEEMRRREWLEHYCKHFGSVEINASYYHMPRAKVCASWRERTPPGFRFTMKMNGDITHRRRLAGCEKLLAEYLEAIEPLGDKLGSILVQLSPKFAADGRRLESFLDICPPGYRWAVEFRHPTWFRQECYDLLRSKNDALVTHDYMPGVPEQATADWAYVRLHGPNQEFTESYPDEMLRRRAEGVLSLLEAGSDVYVYFNNDAHGHAVRNARRLMSFLVHESPA